MKKFPERYPDGFLATLGRCGKCEMHGPIGENCIQCDKQYDVVPGGVTQEELEKRNKKEEPKYFVLAFMMAGRCPACGDYGPLGTPCEDCDHSGKMYEDIDVEDLDEELVGICQNCGECGLKNSLCTLCRNGVFIPDNDVESDKKSATSNK